MRGKLALFLIPLAALAGLYLLYAFSGSFDDDEFQHAHFAWLLWHGQKPYVDFFEHHSPVYHLLLSPLFALGSGVWQIFALRAFSVLCVGGTLVIVYLTARRRLELDVLPSLFTVAILATAPFFFIKMSEARPEPLAIFCYALSIYLATNREELRSPRNLFLAGLMGCLAVLVSTKYAFAILGIVACSWILHGAKAVLLLGGGAAAPCLALTVWLATKGVLLAFIQSVVILNLQWKYHFPPTGYFVEMFTYNGPLVALGAVGLFWSIPDRQGLRQALAWLSLLICGVSGVVLIPVPYRQAFLPLIPVLAIGAGSLVHSACMALQYKRGTTFALAVLLLSCLAPSLANIAKHLTDSNREDLALMRKVEAIDPAPTPVFDGRGLMFYRPHVGRHACMHAEIMMMINADDYSQHVITALRDRQFPVVIRDYRTELMPSALPAFISSNYRPIGKTGIWMPGVTIDRSKLTGTSAPVAVPVAGTYRVSWRGGAVTLDNEPLTNQSEIQLNTDKHVVAAKGFVDELEIILVKR